MSFLRTRTRTVKVADTARVNELTSEIQSLMHKLNDAGQKEVDLLRTVEDLRKQVVNLQRDVDLLHYACSGTVVAHQKLQERVKELLAAAKPFATRAEGLPKEAEAAVAITHPVSEYTRIAAAVKKME